MNKKKYLNILSIFLLVLLFTLSGTCYANWSGAQLEAMLYQNINNIPDGASRNVIYKCVHGNGWALNRDTIPFANYSSIFVRSYRSSSVEWFCDFYCFDNNITFYTQNNNIIPSTNFNCTRYRFDVTNSNLNNSYCDYIGESSFTTTTGSFSNTTDTNGQSFTMVFTNNTIANTNNQTIYGLSYVANFKVEDGEHIISGQGDYPLGKGFLGSHWYANRANLYYAIYKDESEIIINHDINYTEKANGNYEVEYVVPAIALENGAEYSVALYNGENLLYKESSINTIIISGGSSSGDSGGGGGSTDLTQTNNLISQVVSGENKIIQILESGDKKADERDNFWRKTYNRFMQPSGEVLRQMTIELISELPFDSGELSGEIMVTTAGLDLIEEQANDFVIHYDSFEPNFMGLSGKKLWTSGDINFSKMERDIPAVSSLMFYVRAILGFIFICALLHNVWKTLLLTLGISDRLYADEQEEIQKQASIEENWKSRRDYQNYNLWLWRHRK